VTIHIVEDDAAVSDSLALLLSQMGHKVRTYGDGRSFIDSPWSTGDTVLIDLGLPDMSGGDIIRLLQRRENQPKVIIITGQPLKSIERELAELDDAVLLRKPLSIDHLSEQIASR